MSTRGDHGGNALKKGPNDNERATRDAELFAFLVSIFNQQAFSDHDETVKARLLRRPL